jgi:peptidyl-prolyl cis-trans isomerase D
MVKSLQDGGDVAPLASAASLQVQHSNAVRRSGADGFAPGAIVQVFNVPTGGAGQATAAGGGRMVFHVLDSIVQPYDPDKPDSKQIADQMKSGLTEDIISEYVQRLEKDYGASVNQGALQAATGGGDPGY